MVSIDYQTEIRETARKARAEGAKLRDAGYGIDTLPQDDSSKSCGIRAGWRRVDCLIARRWGH